MGSDAKIATAAQWAVVQQLQGGAPGRERDAARVTGCRGASIPTRPA